MGRNWTRAYSMGGRWKVIFSLMLCIVFLHNAADKRGQPGEGFVHIFNFFRRNIQWLPNTLSTSMPIKEKKSCELMGCSDIYNLIIKGKKGAEKLLPSEKEHHLNKI